MKLLSSLLTTIRKAYIWLRDYYRLFRSRRSWKYFFKHCEEENIHTKKIHKIIFGDQNQ